MSGLIKQTLSSREQLLNRDIRQSANTVEALRALEQCIVTLAKITQNQKTWLAYQSYGELRAKITEQVNLLTSIICKTLPASALPYYADAIDRAQRAVLNAYLCSVESGNERRFLRDELAAINIEGRCWGELIASLQSINHWPNRAITFVDGLLSPFDAPVFVPAPKIPSTWSVAQKKMKGYGEHIADFAKRTADACMRAASWSWDKLLAGKKRAGLFLVDCGKSIKFFWKAFKNKYKQRMEKPIPPIINDQGYYIAPPLSDEKKSMFSPYWMYRSLKKEIKSGVHDLKEEIRDGVHQISDALKGVDDDKNKIFFRHPGSEVVYDQVISEDDDDESYICYPSPHSR